MSRLLWQKMFGFQTFHSYRSQVSLSLHFRYLDVWYLPQVIWSSLKLSYNLPHEMFDFKSNDPDVFSCTIPSTSARWHFSHSLGFTLTLIAFLFILGSSSQFTKILFSHLTVGVWCASDTGSVRVSQVSAAVWVAGAQEPPSSLKTWNWKKVQTKWWAFGNAPDQGAFQTISVPICV